MKSSLLATAAFAVAVSALDVLKTDSFDSCLADSSINVNVLNMEYDRETKQINFDISGVSQKEQKVSVVITFDAYGKQVYERQFNPCDNSSYVEQLCPVPKGTFSASGSQEIPESYASQIPAIAFSIPDLDGAATLKLISLDNGDNVACIQSTVTNGKTMDVPSVKYVSAALAGAALLVSGFTAAGSATGSASVGTSPSFGETVGWFQSMAMCGMLSVQYPKVYSSFTSNFGFSTGLVTWDGLQQSIDDFRSKTGGNLTENSIVYLRNTTQEGQEGTNSTVTRRWLYPREIETSVSTDTNDTSSEGGSEMSKTINGIADYSEQLLIPKTNTFMTVLLVFCIAIAAITVGILLFKVILEAWAMFGNFPQCLTGFRKRYWWTLAKTITNLILILYGMWTLYCVYQFTNGDSWAAKLLAGVTLAIFTAILAFFTFKIWRLAKRSKQSVGDVSTLYEKKEVWVKYSLFYENYKKSYWWIFVPTIVYMFVKGCIVAGANGHGMVQVGGQIIVEALMLIMLLFVRPYGLKSSNWINISIQVVRVASAVMILVFVEQLGISQTTKSVMGVVLVAVQSVLTGVLAVLIAINAIVLCCKANPHRQKRKAAEKEAKEACLEKGDQDAISRKSLDLAEISSPRSSKNEAMLMSQGRRSEEQLLHHQESYVYSPPSYQGDDTQHLKR